MKKSLEKCIVTKVVKIKFKKLNKDAKVPEFAHVDDAGFDIFTDKKTKIKKGDVATVSTGISSEIPNGFFVSFRDKSGLAAKHGIHVLGGVIDSGYRGEWGVIITNLGNDDYVFEKGHKVAQGIVHKLEKVEISETKKLTETKRGKGGFGSTGK